MEMFITARKQSLGQGNVLHLPVYLNMQWVGMYTHLSRHPQADTSPPSRHPQANTPPPPRWQLKRVVRILLEYILVTITNGVYFLLKLKQFYSDLWRMLSHRKAYKWQETTNVEKHKTAKLERINVDL